MRITRKAARIPAGSVKMATSALLFAAMNFFARLASGHVSWTVVNADGSAAKGVGLAEVEARLASGEWARGETAANLLADSDWLAATAPRD